MIDHVHKLNVVLYVYDACFFNKFNYELCTSSRWPYDQYNTCLFMTMAVNLYLVELDTIYCSRSKVHLHGEHSEFAPRWYVLTFTL